MSGVADTRAGHPWLGVRAMSSHGGSALPSRRYVAAKAGLAGLTRNAAHAHRRDRIRINGLNIGWTDTEGEDATQRRFHGAGDDWREKAGASLPMGKLGQVDEIADFVVFLLSERSRRGHRLGDRLGPERPGRHGLSSRLRG